LIYLPINSVHVTDIIHASLIKLISYYNSAETTTTTQVAYRTEQLLTIPEDLSCP